MGGKEKLAHSIHQVFPPTFSQYLEPFGGSGAILLSLPPHPARLDIYNDYNSDLVNLFLCARDRTLALCRELRFLPLHSRAEFDFLVDFLRHKDLMRAHIQEELEVAQACFPPEEAEILEEIFRERADLYDVRRAAAFYRRCRESFSGTTLTVGVKPCGITRVLYQITDASRRLQNVVIESKDAMRIIPERDIPDGLIYCDPPYYQAEKSYTTLFSKRAHVRLWRVLKRCRGYVVASYNDCGYIRNLYKDFYIFAFVRNNPMAKKKGARYGELLITNYDPRRFMLHQMTLFDQKSGAASADQLELELIHIPKTELRSENLEKCDQFGEKRQRGDSDGRVETERS